jgi:hypothetical protein
MDFSPPLLEQFAVGLNAPAVIVGELATRPFLRSLKLDCAGLDYFNHIRGGILIPVLWFAVGALIDRRRDRQARPTRINRLASSIALTGLIALAVWWIITVISYGSVEQLLVYVSVLAWLAVGIFVLTRRLQRWTCASRFSGA